jgi:hypothetical protein
MNVHLPDVGGPDRSPWRAMIRSDWPEHFSAATLREEEQFFEGMGAFEPDTYANAPQASAALAQMIRQFSDRGAHVILVLMPEHSRLRQRVPHDAVEVVQDHVRAALGAAAPPLWDMRAAIDDNGFVDLSHLNRSGSQLFSGLLGTRLKDSIPTTGPSLMKLKLGR